MAVKKPSIVYGGPYANESDAIIAESTKDEPNYDSLVSDWKTISQGAHDFIASLKKPVAPEDGVFVNNVVLAEENQTEIDLENL